MGRPRKYADDSEKAKAFRTRHAVKRFATDPDTAATIERISKEFERSESEVIENLVKFALLNRNWFTLGLINFKQWRYRE